MAESADKQFAPTPSRRQKALEQGEVARSRELTAALSFLCAILVLQAESGFLARSLRRLWAVCFDFRATPHGRLSAALPLLLAGGMIAAAAAAGAVLAGAAQGAVFAPARLSPEPSRLNPLHYFRRLFSLESAVELLKAVVKALVIALIGWRVAIYCVTRESPSELNLQVDLLRFGAGRVLLYSAGAMTALAMLDYGYARYRYEQRLRLTREEFEQALKEDEGNPHTRRRRLQLMRRRARRRGGLAQAATATVVLTNPTRYAVALRYRRGYDRAPICVAKGAGELAARIVGIARMGAIPVMQNPPLCRALYKSVNVGEPISVKFYQAVAEILTALMRAEMAAQNARGGAAR